MANDDDKTTEHTPLSITVKKLPARVALGAFSAAEWAASRMKGNVDSGKRLTARQANKVARKNGKR